MFPVLDWMNHERSRRIIFASLPYVVLTRAPEDACTIVCYVRVALASCAINCEVQLYDQLAI